MEAAEAPLFVFSKFTSDEFDRMFELKISFPNVEKEWVETPVMDALKAAPAGCDQFQQKVEDAYKRFKGTTDQQAAIRDQNAQFTTFYGKLVTFYGEITSLQLIFQEAIAKFKISETAVEKCKKLEDRVCSDQVKATYVSKGEELDKLIQAFEYKLNTKGWVWTYLSDSLAKFQTIIPKDPPTDLLTPTGNT